MAKEEKVDKDTGEVTTVAKVDSVIAKMDIDGLLAQLKRDDLEKVQLTGVYLEVEDHKPFRCIFMGTGTMSSKFGDDRVPTVRLLLEDRTVAILAAAMVVGSTADLKTGALLEIEKVGMKEGPRGKYGDYKVSQLG